MNSRWKTFLLFGGLILVGAGALYFIFETIQAKNTGFETKTLWDWMELLLIPLFLTSGAVWINWSGRKSEHKVAEDRANLEWKIAEDRQKETAFQNYFDRMTELLLKGGPSSKKLQKVVVDIVRTRTLSVLRRLDPQRNDMVIQFLRELNLINTDDSILIKADMDQVDLSGASLNNAVLKHTSFKNAKLENTFLSEANIESANLSHANLRRAYLTGTILYKAILFSADLQGADLQGANLKHAILRDANFKNANLKHAEVTDEQLATAKSLLGAIMPDGTIQL